MTSTIQPLGKNILIAPQKAEKKTTTGIFLPDTASEERPQQGKVIAVGESDKILVKAGQTVIYTRYGGTEIKRDGEEYLIVKNEDVLAVIS
jgi:chaperonin GroES